MGAVFLLVQCLWGLPQTLLGLLVALACPGRTRERWRGAVVTRWRSERGLSLGLFLFVPEGAGERLLAHEYGHSLQSLVLGPLYLLVIGLPSLVWAGLPALECRRARRGTSYYAFYTERWADRWGGVDRPRPCAGSQDKL